MSKFSDILFNKFINNLRIIANETLIYIILIIFPLFLLHSIFIIFEYGWNILPINENILVFTVLVAFNQ